MKNQASSQQASKNMNTISNYTLDTCLKLIRSGIKKSGILYKNSFWEENDLLSVGYIALDAAIASYDEGKHAKLDCYISTCISNALKDMNNKEGYLIRVPRTKDKDGNYLTAYPLLFIHSIFNSLHPLIPDSQSFPCPLPWQPQVCSLCL